MVDTEDNPLEEQEVHGDGSDEGTGGEGSDKGDKPQGDDKGNGGNQSEELEALKSQVQQLAEQNRTLLEAVLAGRKDTKEAAKPEPVEEAADAVVDDFSKSGLNALVKRGVLTETKAKQIFRDIAKEVATEVVTNVRNQAAREGSVITTYPELKDANSPLFRKTKELLAADGIDQPTPEHLRLAARAAKAELDREESTRQSRIRQQNGETRRGGRSDEGEGDFTDEDFAVMKAMGVKKENFAKERSAVMTTRRGRA